MLGAGFQYTETVLAQVKPRVIWAEEKTEFRSWRLFQWTLPESRPPENSKRGAVQHERLSRAQPSSPCQESQWWRPKISPPVFMTPPVHYPRSRRSTRGYLWTFYGQWAGPMAVIALYLKDLPAEHPRQHLQREFEDGNAEVSSWLLLQEPEPTPEPTPNFFPLCLL